MVLDFASLDPVQSFHQYWKLRACRSHWMDTARHTLPVALAIVNIISIGREPCPKRRTEGTGGRKTRAKALEGSSVLLWPEKSTTGTVFRGSLDPSVSLSNRLTFRVSGCTQGTSGSGHSLACCLLACFPSPRQSSAQPTHQQARSQVKYTAKQSGHQYYRSNQASASHQP